MSGAQAECRQRGGGFVASSVQHSIGSPLPEMIHCRIRRYKIPECGRSLTHRLEHRFDKIMFDELRPLNERHIAFSINQTFDSGHLIVDGIRFWASLIEEFIAHIFRLRQLRIDLKINFKCHRFLK